MTRFVMPRQTRRPYARRRYGGGFSPYDGMPRRRRSPSSSPWGGSRRAPRSSPWRIPRPY